MTMFGVQGLVGGMRKGASMFQENYFQQGSQVVTAFGHIQKGMLQGIEGALQTFQTRASELQEKCGKSRCGARDDSKAGLEDALRILAEGAREIFELSMGSTLPGAASMEGSPYSHVPGTPP